MSGFPGSSRTRLGAALAALVAVPILSAGHRPASDAETIRALNAGYVRAFLTSDAEWYDRHLTGDYTCVLTNGSVMDRQAFLENARKPHETVAYDLSEITIRVHGDMALASALGTWRRKDGSTGRTRYVDVWVRNAGSWKVVSAQLTSLPSGP